MIFAIHLIFLVLLSWMLSQISRKLPLRVHFFPFLMLKFCAGIAFGLVHYYFYAHYAHGDTFVMFKQSLEGETGSFWKSFFDYDFGKDGSQRANFLIIMLEKINKITLQNYWITNAYFSLLSFTGFWFLANKIVEIFPSTKYPTLIGFLYLPTTLFWTSGISKECIMMQTINTLVFVCLQLNFLWHKTKQWQILIACLFFIA
ncbi:MAG: hypothetical protein NZ521_11470, partial [Flammeovirgaceae bacterium]|nr:hypothetical protein [Flammeovirgaceae bacterium]MDW8288807.1 hypothetical protein [Flammeovirgaceae bacterium]